MTDIVEVHAQVARRQEILAHGCPLTELDECSVLTLKLAEAVPGLLRAIQGVIAFEDELRRDTSTVSTVSRAFADEINRALKGQRAAAP